MLLTRNYDRHRENFVPSDNDSSPIKLWDPIARLAYSVTDLGVTEPGAEVYGTTDSVNRKIQKRLLSGRHSLTVGGDI